MTKKNKAIVIVLLLLCVALIVTPVLALRGAEFGGSDDAGSVIRRAEKAGSHPRKRTEAIGVEAGRNRRSRLAFSTVCPGLVEIHRWGGRGVPRL